MRHETKSKVKPFRTTMAPSTENSSTLMLSPQRNVTFAVNYEVSIVDRFWQKNGPSRLQKKPNSDAVEDVPEATADDNPIRSNNTATLVTTRSSSRDDSGVNTMMEKGPNAPFPKEEPVQSPETTKAVTSLSDEDTGSCKENKKKVVSIKSPAVERQRRSTRELKKREVPVERTRVRYDMELVPAVKRNRAFLDRFPLWSTPSSTREEQIKRLQFRQQTIIKEHKQKLQSAQKQPQPQLQPLEEKKQPLTVDQKQVESVMPVAHRDNGWVVPSQQQAMGTQNATAASCSSEMRASSLHDLQDTDDTSPELVDDELMSPFEDDSSVIWVPKKRSEWEDSVLEMTAVCTSASLRRHLAGRGKSTSAKPFHAPLSKEYIRDRVDIDDPLNGYQIRHKTGGWLQGFILWTNFTTWTHYFKWDSFHAMSGIPTMNSGTNSALVDSDGSLALELEQQPRSGDPFEGGVVFEAVAEISLVGGLGCGEYLLRMALDSIRSKRKYKFVVLQATDSSKTFYERFGFVRVGAICRYERRDKDVTKPGVRPDTPIMGYRHWTHPNESDTSLQKHGGPSYMMCLKLPEDPEDTVIETPFLDEMMKLEVEHKPTIEQLGGTSTPHPKAKRGSLDPSASFPPTDAQLSRNGPKRKLARSRSRGSNGSPGPSLSQSMNANAANAPVLPVLRGSGGDSNPAQTEVNTPKPLDKAAGMKRCAETSGNGNATILVNASAKKRRLSTPADDSIAKGSSARAKFDAGAKRSASLNQEAKTLRRTPRDRSGLGSTQSNASVESQSATVSSEPANQSVNVAAVPQRKTESSKAEGKKAGARKAEAKSTAKRTTPRRNSGPAAVASSAPAVTTAVSEKSPSSSCRSGPMKQKVKSYPRDRIHFYNKVVRPKKGKKTENYFVLHYDEGKGTIRIIPMEPRGILSGKRAGRPRFQTVMTNVEKDAKTVRCSDYEIVKAFMVMKTPVVASEAWDVLDA